MLYNNQEEYGLKIIDSDSSQFSWVYPDSLETKRRNPNFPNNYISHIKENIGKYDYIFVSSHASVREALDEEDIDFTIVYPEMNCKAEWIGRCFIRENNGEPGCSAKVMCDNFESWVTDCSQTGIDHDEIVIESGKYLR